MNTIRKQAQAITQFRLALCELERIMALPEENFRDSAIFAFMRAEETAWRALKWALKHKIATAMPDSSKPLLQEAFSQGWLGRDKTIWQAMANERNLITHANNHAQVQEIYLRLRKYVTLLRETYDRLEKKYPDDF